ncbi:hypothetical protein EHS13_17675 [Paenibacillus psychroresistens]|uniref:Glycerophosphoryl diester phosphodiesterase membrane domain-containing protein n=1 Tax=Paenibacillus psychroresistens TaxID=1778678 RepID=A0A6B8RL51_9BACL|nr:glycerophosphoryl diester phosphodiesterase membrane domain-containing protein [Paenibacillus psychroresistens]QGQ96577.1 hypothetical protein EHS13_17675 [Paenibacillus psychroresistens]
MLKPMGYGQILILSFQIYRTLFVKLFLLVFLLFCLYNLLEVIFFSDFFISMASINSVIFNQNAADLTGDQLLNTVSTEIPGLIAVVLGIMMVLFISIAISTVVFMVDSVNQNKPARIGESMRRSFKRLWSMLVSCFVFFFFLSFIALMFIIAFVIILSFTSSFGLYGFLVDYFQNFFSSAWVIPRIILIVLASFCLMFVYIVVRWSFFIPFVALKEDSVGIFRSWRLTKGSFWRIFAVFFTMYVIAIVLIIVATTLSFLMLSVVYTAILFILINLLISPLLLVAYVVCFFDLRVRAGAGGTALEPMLLNPGFNPTPLCLLK